MKELTKEERAKQILQKNNVESIMLRSIENDMAEFSYTTNDGCSISAFVRLPLEGENLSIGDRVSMYQVFYNAHCINIEFNDE